MTTTNNLRSVVYERVGRVGKLFSRLPFRCALRSVLARAALRLLEPELIPSYSQFGEDRFVDNIFNARKSGVYVDVGCNLPVAFSNTWKLYLKGWSGVAIDANPLVIEAYKKVRTRDTALVQAISNSNEDVDIFVPRRSHLIGGIGEKKTGYWQRTLENSDVHRYRSSRLSDVLRKHDISGRFDFLSIDTEGNELDVLKSLDLGVFLPDVVAVEIHEFEMTDPHRSPVYTLLNRFGYDVVSWIHPTVFFRQAESR